MGWSVEEVEGARQRHMRDGARAADRVKSSQLRTARIDAVYMHGVRNLFVTVPDLLPPMTLDQQYALAVRIVDTFLPVQ